MYLLKTKFGDRAKAFRSCSVAFFWQFVENVFFVSMAWIKIHNTFWQNIIDPYCFLSAVKKCLIFWQKISAMWSKLHSTCPKKTLEAVMFLQEIFLSIIFEVWPENFLMFLKTLFFEVRWTFPKRFFLFLRIQTIIVGIWTKLCALSGQRLRRSVKFPYYISNCFLEEKIISEFLKMFAFHTLSKKA